MRPSSRPYQQTKPQEKPTGFPYEDQYKNNTFDRA